MWLPSLVFISFQKCILLSLYIVEKIKVFGDGDGKGKGKEERKKKEYLGKFLPLVALRHKTWLLQHNLVLIEPKINSLNAQWVGIS